MNGNNSQRCIKRLQKELEDIQKFEETLKVVVDEKNTQIWKISFFGANDTLFAGESYTLQFTFTNDYV